MVKFLKVRPTTHLLTKSSLCRYRFELMKTKSSSHLRIGFLRLLPRSWIIVKARKKLRYTDQCFHESFKCIVSFRFPSNDGLKKDVTKIIECLFSRMFIIMLANKFLITSFNSDSKIISDWARWMFLRFKGDPGTGGRRRGRHRDGDERGERRVLHLHGRRYD